MKPGDKIVYFLDIIDSRTRYLLAFHVSFSRGGKDAKQLMELAEQRAGKIPRIVKTDKLKSYLQGLEDVVGADTLTRQPADTIARPKWVWGKPQQDRGYPLGAARGGPQSNLPEFITNED